MQQQQQIDPNNLTKDQIAEYTRIQNDSAYFAEKFFTVNGEQYSLDKLPYAKDIYKDESEFIILFLARSLTKSTIATNKITHKLVTLKGKGKSAIATAPTDNQAWRLTKEIFRPNIIDSQHRALNKLIEAADGSDQVGEIDLANGSKWTAKGAWATGKAIRGPHRHYGVVDEMQDMTRTAWYVLLEVVNLPGRQIIAMGTGGPQGTLWHELWEKSDKKEWNGKKWTPTNKNATQGYSGYHLSQEWSPFETQASLAEKKKSYPKTLYLTEVECAFFNGAGLKPAPYETTKGLVVTDINETRRLLNSIVTKSIGIDWGNVTRWIVCGMTATNEPVLIRTGSWGDPNEVSDFEGRRAKSSATSAIERELEANERRIRKHLSDAINLINFEKPDYVMCDAGYSKKMPQELMSMFPKKVWAITTGDRKESFPSWTVKNKDSDSKQLLPKEQWEYFCDVDHSAMCEILETHITNKTYHIIDIDQSQSIDEYLLELNMADIVEVESRETVKRRYSITRAHSFAASCYALLPFSKRRRKQTMLPMGY
ncbi:MAG: hypothetical protein OIN87_11970 [Candidatus Methanoperedens sp.]|nr:hypothetical protein [Candidatus Methanoperedens sp.]